jgi:hypothetical protein
MQKVQIMIRWPCRISNEMSWRVSFRIHVFGSIRGVVRGSSSANIQSSYSSIDSRTWILKRTHQDLSFDIRHAYFIIALNCWTWWTWPKVLRSTLHNSYFRIHRKGGLNYKNPKLISQSLWFLCENITLHEFHKNWNMSMYLYIIYTHLHSFFLLVRFRIYIFRPIWGRGEGSLSAKSKFLRREISLISDEKLWRVGSCFHLIYYLSTI